MGKVSKWKFFGIYYWYNNTWFFNFFFNNVIRCFIRNKFRHQIWYYTQKRNATESASLKTWTRHWNKILFLGKWIILNIGVDFPVGHNLDSKINQLIPLPNFDNLLTKFLAMLYENFGQIYCWSPTIFSKIKSTIQYDFAHLNFTTSWFIVQLVDQIRRKYERAC